MNKEKELKSMLYRMFESMPNIKKLPPEWNSFVDAAKRIKRRLGVIEIEEYRRPHQIPQHF